MALLFSSARSFALFALLAVGLFAATDDDAEYGKVATARSEKIVAAINLPDAAKAVRVRAIVSQHYRDLHAIQETRDGKLAAAKATTSDKAAAQATRDGTTARVAQLHDAFLAQLAAELTPEQVDAIKDGLTYGVLPLTYRVYLEMLPTLTDAQKAQIHAWLVEAREHAIDGFTSNEKHAWFGKYKGRINNFLAQAGFDMKQAEKEMLARQKTAPPTK